MNIHPGPKLHLIKSSVAILISWIWAGDEDSDQYAHDEDRSDVNDYTVMLLFSEDLLQLPSFQ